VTGLGFWPILLGLGLIGSALWLKSQETEQERLAVQQEVLRLEQMRQVAEHPELAPAPSADDTLLWLAGGMGAAALVVSMTGRRRR